jgi:hypothetical protein
MMDADDHAVTGAHRLFAAVREGGRRGLLG